MPVVGIVEWCLCADVIIWSTEIGSNMTLASRFDLYLYRPRPDSGCHGSCSYQGDFGSMGAGLPSYISWAEKVAASAPVATTVFMCGVVRMMYLKGPRSDKLGTPEGVTLGMLVRSSRRADPRLT